MAGQPQGEFDVSELIAVEPVGEPQQNIIDLNEPFTLRATFDGVGVNWGILETNMNANYTATFYAEGMGPGVPNIAFGVQNGTLGLGGPYQVNCPVQNGIPNAGIYRCGVTVTFTNPNNNNPVLGWLGFNEECVIQVHPFEE